MVTFRLTKKECYMLLSWIDAESKGSIAVGLPFQEAEITLVKKIRDAIKKQSPTDASPTLPVVDEEDSRLKGGCPICKKPIKEGDPIFQHPKTSRIYCRDCGGLKS